jgi:hypothetical protein
MSKLTGFASKFEARASKSAALVRFMSGQITREELDGILAKADAVLLRRPGAELAEMLTVQDQSGGAQ